MGGTMISSSLIWQGCKANSSASGYTAQLFSSEQMNTIRAMVDVILPSTEDSPSASEVDVPAYIDHMLFGFGDADSNGKLMAALDEFDAKSKADNNKRFHELTDEDQIAMVTQLAELEDPEFDLFGTIRSHAVRGYFTSEEVGEKVLNYKPIPSVQAGCVDLSEIPNGRLWSFG